jgi:ribosomal protein L30/L7E
MTDFIRTLNLIKTRRNLTWLTVSQQEALESLRQALRVPGTVNLFGGTGVGKTFLGWFVADELDYTYFPHLENLKQAEYSNTSSVVLDNCQSSRQAHRDVLKILGFHNINHAILITRQMIQDYTHYVELKLTPADLTKVQDNLASVGLFYEASEETNLWHLVNPYL